MQQAERRIQRNAKTNKAASFTLSRTHTHTCALLQVGDTSTFTQEGKIFHRQEHSKNVLMCKQHTKGLRVDKQDVAGGWRVGEVWRKGKEKCTVADMEKRIPASKVTHTTKLTAFM